MIDERMFRLLKRFSTAARAHFAALEAMDEREANSHARVVVALGNSILGGGEMGVEALLTLVEGGDEVVAGMAAVFTLRYRKEPSRQRLRQLSEGEGLLAFRARVALERFDAGEWEL